MNGTNKADKSPPQEDNNSKLIDSMRSLFKIFSGKENNSHESVVLLPRDVRYMLQYNKAYVGNKEIETLLSDVYGNLGIYLTCKLVCSYNHEFLPEVLNIYYGYKRGTLDWEIYSSSMVEYLKKSGEMQIDGKKIGQISRAGFKNFEDVGNVVINKLIENNQKPVIILYAGLLVLSGVLNHLEQLGCFYCFDPKQGDSHGRKVIKTSDELLFERVDLVLECENNEIVFLDDTMNTGQTASGIQEIFKGKTNKEIPYMSVVKNLG